MPKQTVNLSFSTPNWNWCEIRNPGRNTKSGERCKFCKEVKKRGDATRYYCLIYDLDLRVIDGSVAKCQRCVSAQMLCDNIDLEPVPEQKTGKASEAYKIAKATLKEYQSTYKTLRKNGFPEYIAQNEASESVLKSWTEEAPTTDNFDFFMEDPDD